MNDDLVKLTAQWLFDHDEECGPTALYAPEQAEHWQVEYEAHARELLAAIRVEALTAERDEAREYAAQVRIEAKTAEDARVSAVDERDRLREHHRFSDLHVEALAEIKAVLDGNSDQNIRAIMDGLLKEIVRRGSLKGARHE